jgi:hypothetical protein
MHFSLSSFRLWSSFFFVATILFWLPFIQPASAAEVTFDKVAVTTTESALVVSFTQLGLGDNLTYGISIQDKDGNRILEKTAVPDIGTNRQLRLSVSRPVSSGIYEVYLFARTADNRIATIAYAGTADLTDVNVTTGISQAQLLSCFKTDVVTTFTCQLSQTAIGLTLHYNIHPNTLYTPAIDENSLTIAGETETVSISSTLNPGPYEAVFTLIDQGSGQQIGAQQRLTFAIDGPWGVINPRSVTFANQQFSAEIWFDGPSEWENRMFQYWVVSDKNTICDTDRFELTTLTTRKKNIGGKLPSDCMNPQLVTALYTGSMENGSLVILAKTGTTDIEDLLQQTPEAGQTEMGVKTSANFGQSLMQMVTLETIQIAEIIVASILFILIASLLFLLFRKKLFPPIALLLLLLLSVSSVQAVTFTGMRDNDDLTILIPDDLKAEETGNLVVTLENALQPGTKPSGASVEISIDGGPYQEIMSQTFASPYKNVTFGPLNAGEHTMNVRLPGNFFGFALFGLARFGIATKDFPSVGFTVDLAGNSPYRPQIQGPTTGRPTDVYSFSFQAPDDPDGDSINYEVDWGDGNTQWLPSETTYTTDINNNETAEHSWPSVGSYILKARTYDDVGRVSDWASHTIAIAYLGPTLDASVAFVREDEPINLTWDTTDSAPNTCSITGSGLSGSSLVDKTGTVQATIDGEATFTISCEYGEDTVTVKVLPKIQES